MSMDPFFNNEPGLSPDLTDATHPNPMFDFLTGFVPRKLKDLFKWAEYLAFNSAHIYATTKKFGEYPITKLKFDTDNKELEERHRALHEDYLDTKGFLTKVSFDKFLYGNCFVSIYEPRIRWLKCDGCGTRTNIEYLQYEYVFDRVLFKFTCPVKSCKRKCQVRPSDEKLLDPTEINLIRWDPKLMDIKHNPVTGHAAYYYTIPASLVQDMKKGDRTILDHMPLEFLICAQKKVPFKFAKDSLYHLKVPGPAGVEVQWGLPPITSAIKLFLFAATLRKANEAIALEHIVPMRVLYPQASDQMGSPVEKINLSQWKSEIQNNYKQYRRDPLHVMLAPVPVGVQDIGGQGRALLTFSEVQEAEKNIMLSMGVPPEFLLGGLGQNSGEVTLRMLENQLQTHVDDLNKLVSWISRKVTVFLEYGAVPTAMEDFKVLDDIELKQLLVKVWEAGKLDDAHVFEALNLEPSLVRERLKQEALDNARHQQETQVEIQKMQNSLSQQAQQKANAGGGLQYNVQAITQMAQQQAQQLSSMDVGTRRSELHAMQASDPVMYACTVQALEQITTSQEQSAKTQMAQGGAS